MRAYLFTIMRIFEFYPRRLPENTKFVVFNNRIVTGGETASFAPTLTMRIYVAFGTIGEHFIYVKVGARFPRPHRVAVFSDKLLGPRL